MPQPHRKKRLSQMHLDSPSRQLPLGLSQWSVEAPGKRNQLHSLGRECNQLLQGYGLPNSRCIQHPRYSDIPSPKFNTAPSPFMLSRDLFGLCHWCLFLLRQGHTVIKLLFNHSQIRHCSNPFVLFKPSISCQLHSTS